MPLNINTDLLRAVGIIGPDENRDVYARFLRDYIQANPELRTDIEIENSITRELLITRFLIDEAKANASEFLKSHGLSPVLNERGDPAYHIEWDSQFMALKIKLKIAGRRRTNDNEHFLAYEGREIEIKIANSASNNDFNIQNLLAQITSKVDTVNSLTAGTLKKQIQSLQELSVNELSSRLTEQTPKTVILDTYKSVVKDFLIKAAIAIIKQREDNDSYQPTENEILEQLKIIKQAEINHLSNKPRSILMDFYPQKTETGDLQYMHTVNIPNSDISSESRTLEKRIAPNLFHVLMTTLKLDLNPTTKQTVITKKIKHASLYRSTSLAQLDKQDDAELLEIESLKALLIQKAREQIITRINNNVRADKILKPNADIVIATAYISLLSPFIEKGPITKFIAQASSLLPQTATLGDTLHIKNENEQLKSLTNALAALDNVRLSFSTEDIQYILEHTQDSEFAKRSGRAALEKFLENKRITHANFALNFVSNLGTHLFDWSNNNYDYNLEGLVNLNKIFANFLQNNKISAPPSELIDSTENPNQDWKTLRAKLTKLIISKDFKSDNKVKQAIELYIEIRDFIQLHAQWFNDHKGPNANSLIVDSILTAQKAAELASLLDLEVHAFCKSGKDRTGLFVAGLEARRAASDEDFDSNLYNALHLPNAVTGIPVANGGGPVLQISSDLLKGLESFNGQRLENITKVRDLIASWEARAVGKIGRSYPKADDVRLYLEKQPGAKKSTLAKSLSGPIKNLIKTKTPFNKQQSAPVVTAGSAPVVPPRPARGAVQAPAPVVPPRPAPVVPPRPARPAPAIPVPTRPAPTRPAAPQATSQATEPQPALPINWRKPLQPVETIKEEKPSTTSPKGTGVKSLIKHWENKNKNKKPPQS